MVAAKVWMWRATAQVPARRPRTRDSHAREARRSGARTKGNAPKLAAAAGKCETYILDGGIDAWKKAGLPVALDRKQPIEIMRQVQIAAGSLVLIGVLLGVFVAPGFYILSGFVGAGLLFAGVTGFCGMANILALMPWNKRADASAR